jgi:hypothetical protein
VKNLHDSFNDRDCLPGAGRAVDEVRGRRLALEDALHGKTLALVQVLVEPKDFDLLVRFLGKNEREKAVVTHDPRTAFA